MHPVSIIPTQVYHSPCGELLLGSFEDRLCLCDWRNGKERTAIDRRLQQHLQARYETGTSSVLQLTIAQLDDYFQGIRTSFDVPLLFAGTPFQQKVWNTLLTIPYGQTLSYGELAKRVGNPKAVRAVAAANGANALSILVPCHRVVSSDDRLTGYAGGIKAKRWLLEKENRKAWH